jgi:hypothetical protein
VPREVSSETLEREPDPRRCGFSCTMSGKTSTLN